MSVIVRVERGVLRGQAEVRRPLEDRELGGSLRNARDELRRALADPRPEVRLVDLLTADPGDLAADRVEARQDDGLGRVVDDQVDPGSRLEGADVPALAADDAAFHLVAGNVDGAGGGLGVRAGYPSPDFR